VLSAVLILMPLAAQGRPRTPRGALYLAYFACLGMGFLLVEMPLLQQFILFLGQPAYAFALVLFSLLSFSGLGSVLADRLPVRWLLLLLVGLVLAYPVVLARIFAACIAWDLLPRLLVAALSLGPLGLLLGLPMPAGLRLLRERATSLIPWAWAVNGCASVIGSVVATLGCVTSGFSRVLAGGAFAYLAGWVIMVCLQSHGTQEWS
jgi:MFS family permease